MNPEEQKNDYLWRVAKARVAFRWSLLSYCAVNLFLIGIWYFTSGSGSYFWPKWPLLGWGFGLLMQYVHAFHSNEMNSVEKEYEKLKKNS
jgi:hypothetical protein